MLTNLNLQSRITYEQSHTKNHGAKYQVFSTVGMSSGDDK
jgi:hypothetical protein